MAEILKERYNKKFFAELIGLIRKHHPAFDANRFKRKIFDKDWEQRELKDRMGHIAVCLHDCLPGSYRQALEILLKVQPSYESFEYMFQPDFVERYGMDDWDASLSALETFTNWASSEFAIRRFIIKDSKRTIAIMKKWARSENVHLRRLASEGCRPRLPWAVALPEFKKNPAPILPILESLKADPSEYVRRSVANNLNDISKDNPELVLSLAQKWIGKNADTDRLVKHGLRTLLKAGNREALDLFSLKLPAGVKVENLKTSPRRIKIGDSMNFSFVLKNPREKVLLRLEYAVYYQKASGKLSKKVFKISEKEYEQGNFEIIRKQAFKDLSTRKHHPGAHKVAIIVNGKELNEAAFSLS